MDASELKKIGDAIEQLTEENKKLDNLKQNYVKISQRLIDLGHKLKGISDDVLYLAEEVDPLANNNNAKKNSYVELVRKLYGEAVQGKHFTSRSLDSYGEFDNNQKNSILLALMKMNGMTKVKDGKNVRLYFSDGKSPSVW